jgi:hypothetical protein
MPDVSHQRKNPNPLRRVAIRRAVKGSGSARCAVDQLHLQVCAYLGQVVLVKSAPWSLSRTAGRPHTVQPGSALRQIACRSAQLALPRWWGRPGTPCTRPSPGSGRHPGARSTTAPPAGLVEHHEVQFGVIGCYTSWACADQFNVVVVGGPGVSRLLVLLRTELSAESSSGKLWSASPKAIVDAHEVIRSTKRRAKVARFTLAACLRAGVVRN